MAASRQRIMLLALCIVATLRTTRLFILPGRRALGFLGASSVASWASWASYLSPVDAEEKPTPQEAAAAEAAKQLSLGQRGDELVLPGWFSGEWACFGELYKVETSSASSQTFASALPGAPALLKKSQEAVGTEAGEFRARRRWLSSSRQGPGGGKGVLEDREGVSAGALAAAYTLGGPTPRVKPLDDDWLVAEKWRLSAAGAVARAEVEETTSETPYKALRVSELFEVREKDQQKLAAAVRVVTLWKQAPLPEEGKKKLDTSRKLMQAIQTVYVLPEPSAAADKKFASMTTRFVYSPIRG